MSDFKKWKDNGANYDQGVLLYCSHPRCNANILKNLRRKKSAANSVKLKYELKKLFPGNKEPVIISKVSTNEIIENHNFESVQKIEIDTKVPDQIPKPLIEDLPDEIAIKRASAYKLWIDNCALKGKLNRLPSEAESQALTIQREIWSNLEEQRVLWMHINYYLKNKELLEEPETFQDYTPAKLLRTLQYRYQTKTKATKAIAKYEKELESCTDLAKSNRMTRAKEKNEAKLIRVETDIVKLNKLINSK